MGAKFEGQYPHTSLDLGTSPFRCNLNISQRFWECSPEIFCNHRGVQHRHISEKGEETMKEKLMNAVGTVGIILYYLVSLFICVIPFVMIGASFFLNVIFFAIVQFFPATSIIFWIWGLVCAIKGVQDIWAIIYYILFVVLFVPFFISAVLDLFSSKK